MSWPWSTIGLPDDATPSEIRAAHATWRARTDAAMDGEHRALIDRAFDAALAIAEERDPSYLEPGSDYPNPWRDADAPAGRAPAPQLEHPPVPSADVLATSLLGLVRTAPDFDALAVAMTPLRAWRDAQARTGADKYLREWLVDGGQLQPAQVVRLARLFDWNPQTAAVQERERDAEWRHIVSSAYAIVAPPDPAYTNAMGKSFLVVGAVAAIGLALFMLPRILAGGGKLLLPILLAAGCAYFFIRWRK